MLHTFTLKLVIHFQAHCLYIVTWPNTVLSVICLYRHVENQVLFLVTDLTQGDIYVEPSKYKLSNSIVIQNKYSNGYKTPAIAIDWDSNLNVVDTNSSKQIVEFRLKRAGSNAVEIRPSQYNEFVTICIVSIPCTSQNNKTVTLWWNAKVSIKLENKIQNERGMNLDNKLRSRQKRERSSS